MSKAVTELDVIQTLHDALQPIDDEARARVLTYIVSLLGIDMRGTAGATTLAETDTSHRAEAANSNGAAALTPTYSDFAELFAAANPQTTGEKALVAGYWLQVCQGGESFTGAAANKELTNLGHKVRDITAAMNSMKNQRPMLVLQIKKSGNSRQARKLYKLSHEGIERIKEMVGG